MPLFRLWWCIILMEHLTLEAMESGLPIGQMYQKHSCKEEEQQAEVSVRLADVDTPVEGDSVEDRILHYCRNAAEWVEADKSLFSDVPDVLCMREEAQAEAASQYGRLWKEVLQENERESILEPFKYMFHNPNDVEIL